MALLRAQQTRFMLHLVKRNEVGMEGYPACGTVRCNMSSVKLFRDVCLP